MTALVRQVCLLIPFVFIPSLGHAQAPSIAEVSQVIPFAVSGSVTSGAAQPQIIEKSIGGTSPVSGSNAAPLQAGLASVVTSGEKISTADNAAVSLVLGDVGAARMGASSEVRLPAQGQQGHSLEMLKGRLFLNVSGKELKQRKSEFKLKTPAALLAVKGTKFFSDSKEGVDTIGVHEGSVTVTEPESGKEVVVEAGYGVEVRAGSLGQPRKLLADEEQLNAQYQLANVRRLKLLPVVSLNRQWMNGIWQHTFRVLKDGKQTLVTFPEKPRMGTGSPHDYEGDEPVVIGSEGKSKGGRRADQMTPEGYFRTTWSPPEATQLEATQGFTIRGAELVRLFTEKIIGISFRYRAMNVEPCEVITRPETKSVPMGWLEVPLGGVWKTGVLGGLSTLDYRNSIELKFQWQSRKHRDVVHPVPPPSTVDVTDFELLLTE